MFPVQRFVVSPEITGQRLDRALANLTVATRSHIKMLIEHACVLVAGEVRKAGYILRLGEEIEVWPIADPPAEALPQDLPLDILYEDEFLAAINKPPGMVVHPAPGQWQGTIVNALLARWGWREGTPGNLRPGIIHRLDKDTSGVLLIAKDPTTQERLSLQFKERRVQKMYTAVVVGRLVLPRGEIHLPIGRHPSDRKKMSVHAPRSRAAISRYQVIGEAFGSSVIHLFPETGRTHQLRVHLAALGHPIVGDLLYGSSGRFCDLPAVLRDFPRQALHARAIRFCHPATQRLLTLWAPYPEDLQRVFAMLPFVVEERSTEELLNRDGKAFPAL